MKVNGGCNGGNGLFSKRGVVLRAPMYRDSAGTAVRNKPVLVTQGHIMFVELIGFISKVLVREKFTVLGRFLTADSTSDTSENRARTYHRHLVLNDREASRLCLS